MNTYRETYRRICTEVEVLDESTFRHVTLGSLRLTREIDAETCLPVLAHLWRFLYLNYYAADVAAATVLINGSRTVLSIADREDAEFVARLSAANPSQWYAEPGWRVVGSREDELAVRRDGLTLTVTTAEVGTHRMPAGHGDTVSVRFPAERRFSNPGWYVAIGSAGLRRNGLPVVRLYYSLAEADAAPPLLRAIAEALNAHEVPFHLKVANNPAGFGRNDPVVTYVAATDWPALRLDLERLHTGFRSALRDTGPCFARRLDHGWSMAAEPTGANKKGVSFGQQRCILVAEGLLLAWSGGARAAVEREAAVLERLRGAGIDPDHPYLDPGAVPLAGAAT